MEVKVLAASVGLIITISGATAGAIGYFATEDYVDARIAMSFQQMIDYRIQNLREQLNQINMREIVKKPWPGDQAEKDRINRELDRLYKQQQKGG